MAKKNNDKFYITFSASAVIVILIMVISLLGVILSNGIGVIWPHDIAQLEMKDGSKMIGHIVKEDQSQKHDRIKVHLFNRDLNTHTFLWIDREKISSISYPEDIWMVERLDHGIFVGKKGEGSTFFDANNNKVTIENLDHSWQPNQMGVVSKSFHYGKNMWKLFWEEPREANTEGGLFPAIFGTVILIFIMSTVSFPIGVITGIYLKEYATDGILVRMVHITVNNLAGIPSIVYGIFGLSFFVYGIGGQIDSIFFADSLPTPTFGTGGILWASLTLGLLTIPVVIVATEEALSAIPRGIKEGSMALGTTKLQMLTKVLLPMATPGIMTGFILAMSRAAGEVAPLMLTGVVKMAPSLPLDGTFPFLHLDRKFMHLGFHIYDLGFQSPNVDAAKPMVYMTALILMGMIILLNVIVMYLRNRMKQQLSSSAI